MGLSDLKKAEKMNMDSINRIVEFDF
jgi:hypothetical protein